MAAPVIMVHGAFCGGWAFDAFRAPFEAAGHVCHTPDLPGHGPGEGAAGRSMSDYAGAIAALIRSMDEPPALIGHSMGGLVSLMAAGLAPVSALVLISPSPPWGVTGGSMGEALQSLGLMGLGAHWGGAIDPDYSLFANMSGDRLPRAEQQAAFARLRPESGRALHETMNWWLDPFMTTAPKPPIGAPPTLAVTGGRDQIHAPALVRQIAERCRADFRQFDEMSHWMLAEPGHAEVARTILGWLPAAREAAA